MFDKSWTGLFKQASEMQSKLAEIQEGLAKKTVEVSTGGGMVKVVANGLNEILSIGSEIRKRNTYYKRLNHRNILFYGIQR